MKDSEYYLVKYWFYFYFIGSRITALIHVLTEVGQGVP